MQEISVRFLGREDSAGERVDYPLQYSWARRSNQSILKISPRCSLEGMMLKLKLQYFGHLMRRVDSLEKTDAGRDWGQEEKGMTKVRTFLPLANYKVKN